MRISFAASLVKELVNMACWETAAETHSDMDTWHIAKHSYTLQMKHPVRTLIQNNGN